jgi:tetratricopeptide (TPR) repeat protein
MIENRIWLRAVGLTLLLVFSFNRPSFADSATEDQKIIEWVDLLASGNFQERREAFLQLWRSGDPALKAVQQAMASPDAQQSASAATLDVLIRMNVPADDPQQATEFIQILNSNPQLAISKLCERGFWKVAAELLSLDAAFSESFTKSPIYNSRIMSGVVDEAIEQENLELAWPIVRQAMPLRQATWVAHKIQLPPPEQEDTPNNRAWQFFVTGKMEEVFKCEAADEFKAQLALRGFAWKDLATPPLLDAYSNTRKQASKLALRAVVHEFAGDMQASRSEWNSLFKSISGQTQPIVQPEIYDDTESNSVAKQFLSSLETDPVDQQHVEIAYMLCGYAKSVQDYLMESDPTEAWSVCIARGDQAAALKAIGLEDLNNFTTWLKRRREELNAGTQRFFADASKFQATAELASTLLGLGHFKESEELVDMLAIICRGAKQNEDNFWEILARSMYRSEGRARFLKVFEKSFSRMSREAQSGVLRTLYPDYPQSIEALLDTAPPIPNPSGAMSKIEAVEQLWLWNRSKFEPESSKTLTAWIRKAVGKLAISDETSGSGLAELAELCHGLGLNELAMEFATSTEQGGVELWSQAAELLLKRGEIDAAIAYLSAIRRMDGTHQEAIYDEANAILTKGRQFEADELQTSRWMRPIGVYGGPNSWYAVASRLSDAERYELALEYIEAAFKVFNESRDGDNDDPGRQIISVGFKYADIADELKDHQTAADARRAVLLTGMTNFPLRHNFTIYIAAKERVNQAVLAARAGDMQAFRRHAYVSESLQPLGIEIVEETYNDLVTSGNQEEADAVFARMEKRMLAHIERWPKDATAHNNLAWMYARCNQKLDEALSHSQTAVDLAPNSAVLLDTLAEVHFRRGQVDKAIAAIQRCIELDPREAHMRRQLDRFLRAKRS